VLTEPVLEDIPTAVEDAVTDVPQVTRDAEAVAEIRALLEAMAEPPVATPEPVADVPPATEPGETIAPLEEPAAEVSEPSPILAEGTLVLTLQTGPATFTIAQSTAMLGRGEDNTIRLDDLSVSRRHARIVYRRASYWLSDLGSMGGTWVNGSRLAAPHEIALGDVIDIGHCRLMVSYVRETPNGDGKPKAARRRPARR
jgi:pSer/pThr/pTyr-binding forkhead associated (FHA) protein